METTEKVRQVVLYGSVYESLYKNFVNMREILNYLKDAKYTTEHERKRFCVAYRIICLLDRDDTIQKSLFEFPQKFSTSVENAQATQYFTKHFLLLSNNDDFIMIYYYTRNHSNDFEVMKKIQEVVPKVEEWGYHKAICDMITALTNSISQYSAATRSLKFLNNYSVAELLGADYLAPLEKKMPQTFPEQFIIRCMFLKKNAPLYWQDVMFGEYFAFAQKHYSKPNFSKEVLDMFALCFPGLYDEKILKRSPIIHFLHTLPKNVAAYYLGFPIHEYMPSNSKIEEAIDFLNEVGVEKYLEKVRERNSEKRCVENAEVVNSEDMNCDEISDFNPFDVVCYYTDDGNKRHKFCFTRPEFASLLKGQRNAETDELERKNFYTREKLPEFVIQQIKSRLRIASIYNLPPAKPLPELLVRMGSGEREEEKNSGIPPSQSVPNIPQLQFEQGEDDEYVEDDEEEDYEEYDDEEEEEQEKQEENENDATHFEVVAPGSVGNMPEIIGRAKLPNGKILPFKFQVPPSLQRLSIEEQDEAITEVLAHKNMQFLGRIDPECECPECMREIQQMN